MINFNKDSAFDLKPISIAEVRDEVNGLLIAGEEIACAFKTIRDQLIFTNKRIIPLTFRASPENGNRSAPCPFPRCSSSLSRHPALLS